MTIDKKVDEQKCDNYYTSRAQRQSEINLGIPYSETNGFHKVGCYSCEGNNLQCRLYSKLMDYAFVMNEFPEEEWEDM